MRIEYCKDSNASLCCLRAIQGLSGGIPISPELMKYTLISDNWKEHIYHRGISWNFHPILASGLIPGGNREWQGPSISLLYSPETISDKTRKKNLVVLITPFLKYNTMRHISEGSQTAIQADKIICNHQCQEIALIEWLLRTNIEIFSNDLQHQGHNPRSRWRVIDKHSSSSRSSLISRMTFRASRNSPQLPTSAAKDDTHLTVKEELNDTNTKDIEGINIGSNKICIREDLGKKKMVFSKESSQPFSTRATSNLSN